MKILLAIAIGIIIMAVIFQIYITMASGKSEIQSYEVIRTQEPYEIRYYPPAIMAKISSTSKSYRDLGYSGFGKLANYIFGGNSANKQIAMTSPVHMDIGDTLSTMSFVIPSEYTLDDLPKPNNAEINIQTTDAEYVAVISFGGFASNDRIHEHQELLRQYLIDTKVAYFGNFRFLGYNPPYQLLGRRNEIIVTVDIIQ